MPNKDPDILIIALARWDAPYSSTAFSLAKELSNSRRVFLIDNPYTFKDVLLKGWSPPLKRRLSTWFLGEDPLQPQAKFPNLYTCTPPLMLPINWLPAGSVYDFFSRINQHRMKRFIQKLLRKQAVEVFDLLNIFNPFYSFHKLRKLNTRNKVYYSVDRIRESVYISKHGPRLEKEIASQADFCLATSRALQADLHSFTQKPVFLLPNAANVSLFQQVLEQDFPKPIALQDIHAPIVLYVGAIGIRIDFELMDQVSREHQDVHFVCIGPKGSGYDKRLEERENVRFTGPIAQEKLPAYFQHAAVGIIPFKVNKLTAAIYPLKIHEYLAAGLPVVSTPFSVDIESFKDKIFLSSSPEEFGNLIKKTIKQTPVSLNKRRVSFVEASSWESRAKELLERLK